MGVDRLIVVDVSFPLARSPGPRLGVRHHQPDGRHHGPARHARIQGAPAAGRRADRARPRRDDRDRVRPHAAGAWSRASTAAAAQAAALASAGAAGRRVRTLRGERSAPRGARGAGRIRAAERAQSQDEARRVEAVFGDLAGQPLDTPELQQRLASQYRLDDFESVDYRIVREPRGERGSRSTCAASPGGRRSCGSASASRTTTKAARRPTRPPSCASRTSTRSTPNGSSTRRSARSRSCSPSSTSRCRCATPISSRRRSATKKATLQVVNDDGAAHRALPHPRHRRLARASVQSCRTGAKCASACGAATAAAAC